MNPEQQYNIKPIPASYRGTPMRSTLETQFAKFCNKAGWKWAYEPRTFTCPSGEVYIPDFLVEIQSAWYKPNPYWIELKPTLEMARASRQRMEIILCTYPDANLITVIPSSAHPWGPNGEGYYLWWNESNCPFMVEASFVRNYTGEVISNFVFIENGIIVEDYEEYDEAWWWGSEDGYDGRFGDIKHWGLKNNHKKDLNFSFCRSHEC